MPSANRPPDSAARSYLFSSPEAPTSQTPNSSVVIPQRGLIARGTCFSRRARSDLLRDLSGLFLAICAAFLRDLSGFFLATLAVKRFQTRSYRKINSQGG